MTIPGSSDDFERAIHDLSLSLFEKIPSQSTEHDKRSLLACQSAVRELCPSYVYLEIGSYLGGSIQPHLLDERCTRIYSIDKRPDRQPDERGIEFRYLNNSTGRMLENLSKVSKTEKIVTIDGDTAGIGTGTIKEKIDLCFIDGEHTDSAVVRDFAFCRSVVRENGAIIFHDAQITYNGISDCIEQLRAEDIGFKAYILPHIVFVVELGDFPLHRHPKIAELLLDNHESYLFSLRDNDHYRRFANKLPFRVVKNFISRLKKGNVSE